MTAFLLHIPSWHIILIHINNDMIDIVKFLIVNEYFSENMKMILLEPYITLEVLDILASISIRWLDDNISKVYMPQDRLIRFLSIYDSIFNSDKFIRFFLNEIIN